MERVSKQTGKLHVLETKHETVWRGSNIDTLDRSQLQVGPFSMVRGLCFLTIDNHISENIGIPSTRFFPQLYRGKLIFPREGVFKSEIFFDHEAFEKIAEENSQFYVEATRKLLEEYEDK